MHDMFSNCRGKVKENAPLAKLTYFKVGGSAQYLFEPQDMDDLITFIKNKPKHINVMIMGLASNLLIRDGGIDGVVVRLKKGFSNIEQITDDIIEVGAGCSDLKIAKYAAKNGMVGFSFLSGIPGSIGGALRMNAGAFGSEIKDILLSAKMLDENGNIIDMSLSEMGMEYRHCSVAKDYIFLSAKLKATGKAKTETLEAQINDIQSKRDDSQPKGAFTGGSTFANPEGYKAWQLIDSVGMRGYKIGGAMVSEKHCNFLINTGNATASDIENLGELIRQKVKEKHNIQLRWEIKRIGKP